MFGWMVNGIEEGLGKKDEDSCAYICTFVGEIGPKDRVSI